MTNTIFILIFGLLTSISLELVKGYIASNSSKEEADADGEASLRKDLLEENRSLRKENEELTEKYMKEFEARIKAEVKIQIMSPSQEVNPTDRNSTPAFPDVIKQIYSDRKEK